MITYTEGKIEENQKFVKRFTRNTAWMKDQWAEDVERRMASWGGASRREIGDEMKA